MMRAMSWKFSNHRQLNIRIAVIFMFMSLFTCCIRAITMNTVPRNIRRIGIRTVQKAPSSCSKRFYTTHTSSYAPQLQALPSRNENEINPFGEHSPFSTGTKTDPTEFRFTFANQRQGSQSSPTRGASFKGEMKEIVSHSSTKVHSPLMSSMVQLKEELQRFRIQQSESLHTSVNRVFTNTSLEGICESLPTTKEQLLLVPGIGPKKVEMFGTRILTIVSAYKGQRHAHGLDGEQSPAEEGNAGNRGEAKGSNLLGEIKKVKLKKTQLREELREYRIQQAGSAKPAYTIFTNAALEGIYASLPKTKQELLDVKGIGKKKIEMFGDDILEIVSKYISSEGSIQDNDKNISNVLVQPTQIKLESLSAEQKRAAEIALGKDHGNIFITGSAGTGKSHLLKYLVQEFKEHTNDLGEPQRVGICAPTGVAAILVGGSTLHSFFGIGLGTGSIPSLLKKVSKSSAAMKRIEETDVLIIDECSMLSSHLLEKLDAVAREIRRNGHLREHPFGGMQVIAFGDFFQLPPVERFNEGDNSWNDRRQRAFCFDSQVWSDLGLSKNVIELKDVQRQENNDFISLLHKVRVGKAEEADIQHLNSKCLISKSNPLPNDGILPTRLYVLNKDVDSENISRLNELKSEKVVCQAIDTWRETMPVGTPAATKKQMKESLRMEMPDEVQLKVGAQVMLTRNKDLDNNLVNGSRGVIERFVDGGDFLVPVVRFDDGVVTKIPPVESIRYNPDGGKGCLVRIQIPLKLAWAITIHKSQGSTLTRALLDISSAFEYGQCYVALSRVKSLDGLWLEKPARLSNIMVSPQVINFFDSLR